MTDAPTTPDPIEIAMEAEAAGRAPHGVAHELLVDQRRLVRWQIASERAGFALKVLVGLAGLAVAIALAAMAWRASRADGVVVEPFSVPPTEAARGLTGPVVAGEVLDRLAQLDRVTNPRSVLRVSDSWSQGSRVQIPQTGVSLDELDRLLRRWFGHETEVTGAVIATADGIVLTARAGDGTIVRAAGRPEDLPALAQQVAEQLLAQARPLRYGRLMQSRGRWVESVRAFTTVIQTSSDRRDIAAAHSALGGGYLVVGNLTAAQSELRQAISMGSKAFLNAAWVEYALGHAGAAADFANRQLKAPGASPELLAYQRAHRDMLVGDFGAAERGFGAIVARQIAGQFGASRYQDHILALIGTHDVAGARAELPLLTAILGGTVRAQAFRRGLRVELAIAEGAWSEALAALDEGPLPAEQIGGPAGAPRALVLARLGRIAEARALAATLPGDCSRCLRTRAQVAEAAGDRAGADRALAEDVRQNPKIPFAEADWARLLLARGDTAGAIAKARAAHARSPNFADPLEVWGEALLARGDAKGAAAKFAEARPHAPNWDRLRAKTAEAKAKLRENGR